MEAILRRVFLGEAPGYTKETSAVYKAFVKCLVVHMGAVIGLLLVQGWLRGEVDLASQLKLSLSLPALLTITMSMYSKKAAITFFLLSWVLVIPFILAIASVVARIGW